MTPRPDLTHAGILEWADRFHARVGRWPTRADGTRHLPESNWSAIDKCLKLGLRGLPNRTSLARLLLDCRQRRHKGLLPRLTVGRILAWADAHHARTGAWPHQTSGPVADAPDENWDALDRALAAGGRGLPGGSSLARLLFDARAVRYVPALPRLTVRQILAWADAHRARTGEWPQRAGGRLVDAPEHSWASLDSALKKGLRGLRGGGSLARLLHAKRGVPTSGDRPRLKRRLILAWADAHRARTGDWPTADAGEIPGTGETWQRVETALGEGLRGLPGGDSLARLLARHRGRRNPAALPSLAEAAILAWADAHHARTGRWPRKSDGPVAAAPDETWAGIHAALLRGGRGLSGGSTLARLLSAARGVPNRRDRPALTVRGILAWADAHHRRTGTWPTSLSGTVARAPGETWSAINAALRVGGRGLPGGASLAGLLAAQRGVHHHLDRPALTRARIRHWALRHRERTGEWPRVKSGPVADAPGETWAALDEALRSGHRGLPGGSSLHQVIHRIV